MIEVGRTTEAACYCLVLAAAVPLLPSIACDGMTTSVPGLTLLGLTPHYLGYN